MQVTGAKLNTDVISAQTALTAAPADTDEFMVSDAGVLKRIDYSLIKGGGAFTYINGATSASEVSALTLDSVFSSTYQNYLIVFGITIINGSNNRSLLTRVRHGGTTVTGGSYHTAGAYFNTEVTSAGNIRWYPILGNFLKKIEQSRVRHFPCSDRPRNVKNGLLA